MWCSGWGCLPNTVNVNITLPACCSVVAPISPSQWCGLSPPLPPIYLSSLISPTSKSVLKLTGFHFLSHNPVVELFYFPPITPRASRGVKISLCVIWSVFSRRSSIWLTSRTGWFSPTIPHTGYLQEPCLCSWSRNLFSQETFIAISPIYTVADTVHGEITQRSSRTLVLYCIKAQSYIRQHN